ncbi:hypothetical protein N5J66_05870 [Pseudomonas juntendi]|jgi:hypothetical protein|uniref:Uncharacterized protein n=1 Tax=Pseudomonas juntendi TaxID=2666183 RepID=A0A7W2KD60_9PSED|nr:MULTISPECIES: hypothetical protein [Pseudomonas]MBA6096330.1 hypothetical protein [Pseudomonas juntendi]MBH3372865.1 hypothetical protein [Pseudomonas juntendi]MBN4165100.1 hypothetical protein [Pseudomonas fulva]MDH2013497.1 hypothetical protein [Pseudomonas juntendi]QDC04687.1 hypothetical protein FH041_06985 [Pseudomonas sp. SWI7]
MTEQRVIDAINSHGDDIKTISCIIAGLLQQLRESQGAEGIESARQFALAVAQQMGQGGATAPDVDRINLVFNQHK